MRKANLQQESLKCRSESGQVEELTQKLQAHVSCHLGNQEISLQLPEMVSWIGWCVLSVPYTGSHPGYQPIQLYEETDRLAWSKELH